MRRVLVLGLARSGLAAQAAPERRGVEVVAADRTLGNDEDAALLDAVDVLVKSPGVPGENALVVAARERGIEVWSEVELGYRLLGARLVGVTGTNGKTTTSELLGAILGVQVAGNVGRPLTDIKPNLDVADVGNLLSGVINSLTSYESEIQDKQGCWYALRIRPYVTVEGQIDGASLVLWDIDKYKRALAQPRPETAKK